MKFKTIIASIILIIGVTDTSHAWYGGCGYGYGWRGGWGGYYGGYWGGYNPYYPCYPYYPAHVLPAPVVVPAPVPVYIQVESPKKYKNNCND